MRAGVVAAGLLLTGASFSSFSIAEETSRSDSIPHAGAFTDDPTLSRALRLKIARFALQFGTTQTKLPFQILPPGTYAANDLPYRSEGPWQALTVSGEQVDLVPVRVRLHRDAYPYATGDSTLPGVRVETGIRDTTMVLIRSLKGRRLGPPTTWYVGEGQLSAGGALRLRESARTRWAITASPSRHFQEWNLFRITLRERKSGRTQTLGEFEVGVSPSFLWIGDLDEDGRLDLFVRDNTSESGSVKWTLYLSSLAAPGALFGKAAEFYTPGC